MLNQPSGTRAYEIESENEEYSSVLCLLKFKKDKLSNDIWGCAGFTITRNTMKHDGFGFTTLFSVDYKGTDIGNFYRLKNAKKAAQEHNDFYL